MASLSSQHRWVLKAKICLKLLLLFLRSILIQLQRFDGDALQYRGMAQHSTTSTEMSPSSCMFSWRTSYKLGNKSRISVSSRSIANGLGFGQGDRDCIICYSIMELSVIVSHCWRMLLWNTVSWSSRSYKSSSCSNGTDTSDLQSDLQEICKVHDCQ